MRYHPILLFVVLVGLVAFVVVGNTQQPPQPPTCEQQLSASYGQLQATVQANVQRESQIRAEYEARLVALGKELMEARAGKATPATEGKEAK